MTKQSAEVNGCVISHRDFRRDLNFVEVRQTDETKIGGVAIVDIPERPFTFEGIRRKYNPESCR